MKRVYTATEDPYAGWSESKSSEVLQVCDKIYNLEYELRNCIKGAYTGAKTYPELAEYIVSLGEELVEAGENMKYRG